MKAMMCAIVVPLLLAGCTTASLLPEVLSYKSPLTSGEKLPQTRHQTTLMGYTHREPSTPEAWVEEGDAAAPDASMEKEECKKTEGAGDDCPT